MIVLVKFAGKYLLDREYTKYRRLLKSNIPKRNMSAVCLASDNVPTDVSYGQQYKRCKKKLQTHE